ncbi:MAG: hypothetical protein ABW072_09440 [Sedimenticola sp.]
MKTWITLLAITMAMVSTGVSAKNLKVCVDDEWYPYTYVQDDKAVGIHVDVVKKPLKLSAIRQIFSLFPGIAALKWVKMVLLTQ